MGEIYDLKIVPTSISYEKVLEEQLFVYELLGIPKPKESTSGFFKAVKSLMDKNYGKMYFDFGSPISLNQFFGDKINKFRHSSEPAHVQKLNGNELLQTTDLAHFVVRQQQKKIVIMTYNLIALIYNQFVFKSKELTMLELQTEVQTVAQLFEKMGAIVNVDFQNILQNIEETINVHDNILEIVGNNACVRLKTIDTAPAKRDDGIKLKGHWICKEVMDKVVPVFSLQLYCNPTLFWLSQPTFFVLSLFDSQMKSLEHLKQDVSILRNVFIYEFVLYPRFADEEFDETLKLLLSMQVIQLFSDDTTYCLNYKHPCIDLFLSAIAPFLSCFLYTSMTLLLQFSDKKFTDKDVFIAAQSSLETELIKGNSKIHPYSLCLDSITTTILSLCNNGCLIKEKQLSIILFAI